MTPLAIYAAIAGLLFFRLGLLTSTDNNVRKFASPGLAGSGAAVFLGVVTGSLL